MSLYQEQIDSTELVNWDNYRLLLHEIFQVPKKQKTREEKLQYMRDWWARKGKEMRNARRAKANNNGRK